jgi:ribosomal protein L11 methyltransferase
VVRAAVPAADADVATDAMWQAGAIAIEERDTPSGLLLVAGAAPGADIGRLLAAVDRRWPAEVVAVDIDAALDAWRPFARAVRAGDRLVVRPPWVPVSPAGGAVDVVIDPGRAFGSGAHASTRLALAALERLVGGGERVLDAGCGSGILAAAALALGAGTALAFDVDPNALPYARALLEANGLAARCELRLGSFEVLEPSERFQGAMANLDSSLIRSHARNLAASLVGVGWFVCSGCTSAKRGATLAALASAGLRVERIDVRGRWDLYAGRRTEYAF